MHSLVISHVCILVLENGVEGSNQDSNIGCMVSIVQ